MRIDRLLYPVSTLGPGDRVTLWTSGCSKHCDGCANPELWHSSPSQDMGVDAIAATLNELASAHGAHRLTLTGGDPLEQPGDLMRLLRTVRAYYNDVLLYTGFRVEEVSRLLGSKMHEIEGLIDVLIDGRYVADLNKGTALRGSSNQRVIFLNESLRETYESYMQKGRVVQNFVTSHGVISVGIHEKE